MKKRRPAPRSTFTDIRQTVRTPYGEFAIHGVNHGEPVPVVGRLILQPRQVT